MNDNCWGVNKWTVHSNPFVIYKTPGMLRAHTSVSLWKRRDANHVHNYL